MAKWTFNPFTGTFDKTGEGGGGGGGNITITGEDAIPITGINFVIEGLKANGIDILEVDTGSGDIVVKNNAWETQYVIDQSNVDGLKGTFQTIQSALDKAKLDGMDYSNPKKFIIRNGTYVENLFIYGGAFFESAGYSSDPTTSLPFATILGSHTLDDICEWGSNGITWQTNSGDLFTTGASYAICLARNSVFLNLDNGQILEATTGTTSIDWYDCQFLCQNNPFSSVFNIGDPGLINIRNCNFSNCGFTVNGGVLRLKNCDEIGQINLINCDMIAVNCSFAGDSTSNIFGISNGVRCYNCQFTNNIQSHYAIDIVGSAFIVNCYLPSGIATPRDFLSPTVVYRPELVTLGNVLKSKKVNNNYTSGDDNYIGVSDTSSPRSIKIRTGPIIDYQVYVVDESGGASINNITITDVYGALINGAASYVINQNYGSVLLHTDGIEWYIISSSNTSSGGSSEITFVTDDGTSLTSSYILNINGIDSIENNDDGIITRANPNLSNNTEIILTNRLQGTATSTNASTENIIIFNLGLVNAAYRFRFEITGRETTTNDCVGYTMFASAKTDGTNATIIASPFTDNDEDIPLLSAAVDLDVSGNNIILRVTGVASQTIIYKALGSYVVV